MLYIPSCATGESPVSDWFEEQLDLLLANAPTVLPTELDCQGAGPVADPASAMEAVDWAFADADTTYLSHDVHPLPGEVHTPNPRSGHSDVDRSR